MGIFRRRRYRVTPLGRSGVRYQEGERSLRIESEMLGDGPFERVINLASLSRWDDGEVVSATDRARIVVNLREGFRGERVDWVFEPPGRSPFVTTRVCPCCACLTIDDRSSAAHEICELCGWEDDEASRRDPALRGANRVSLEEARRNFEALGISDPGDA